MAWTEAERDQVKAAILALASGTRKASVSYTSGAAGGRTVSYVPAQLDELRSLLAEMEASATAAPRFRRVAFSKGFRRSRGSDE